MSLGTHKYGTHYGTSLPPDSGREYLSDERPLLTETTKTNSIDYVNRLDLNNGNVRDNVRHVMNGLLEKEITIPEPKRSPVFNPLVNIEKRHKRVKEKRARRELVQNEIVKEKKLKEEIQQKAKEMVKREEDGRLRKEKQEEEAIKVHVVAIKRQMKQQKERER